MGPGGGAHGGAEGDRVCEASFGAFLLCSGGKGSGLGSLSPGGAMRWGWLLHVLGSSARIPEILWPRAHLTPADEGEQGSSTWQPPAWKAHFAHMRA